MNNKSVYIIVLNYNGKKHLEYSLPSILESKYNNFKVILVDNNSTDDSLIFVQKNFPNIEVIKNNKNLGWAGGNNIGINHVMIKHADYIVLANNDIRVHPLWIQSAVDAFSSDQTVGFVGCTVFGIFRAEPLDAFNKACENLKKIKINYTNDYIDGLALFVKASVFINLGMIDEAFFAYVEDTDLELRGKLAGYKRIKTNVPIWHYSSGSFGKIKIKASYYEIRNRIRFNIKHYNFKTVIRHILKAYYTGCWPLYKEDMTNIIAQRQRPKGIIFNFFLITFCVFWNLLHIKKTIKQKREDYNKIKMIKEIK